MLEKNLLWAIKWNEIEKKENLLIQPYGCNCSKNKFFSQSLFFLSLRNDKGDGEKQAMRIDFIFSSDQVDVSSGYHEVKEDINFLAWPNSIEFKVKGPCQEVL